MLDVRRRWNRTPYVPLISQVLNPKTPHLFVVRCWYGLAVPLVKLHAETAFVKQQEQWC